MDEWLRRLLRIPKAPSAPAGSLGSARVFRAAGGFYFYRLCTWLVRQGFLFMLVSSALMSLSEGPGLLLKGWAGLLQTLVWTGYVGQLLGSFLMVGVDYRLRWYVVTDRSLRIREGVLVVQEQTLSYANIQNVSIGQGPLQRIFGIQDLMVHTAGGGTPTGQGQLGAALGGRHVGLLKGVNNAEAIRDLILGHVRQLKGAGLGDPEQDDGLLAHPARQQDSPAMLAAARALKEEAAALRRQLEAASAEP